MKYRRVIFQGFGLTLANITAILFAFGLYQIVLLFRPVNQRALQTPLAILINIIIFLLWTWLVRRYIKRYSLQKRSEYYLTYFAAGMWNPIIFIPLHYLTQGYLTSFANIIILWIYQVLVNLLVLFAAYWLSSRMSARGEKT